MWLPCCKVSISGFFVARFPLVASLCKVTIIYVPFHWAFFDLIMWTHMYTQLYWYCRLKVIYFKCCKFCGITLKHISWKLISCSIVTSICIHTNEHCCKKPNKKDDLINSTCTHSYVYAICILLTRLRFETGRMVRSFSPCLPSKIPSRMSEIHGGTYLSNNLINSFLSPSLARALIHRSQNGL